MRLRNLFFGTVDGKNELITSSDAEIERFLFSFLIPPTVLIDELLDRSKYFVTGMKGSGKTSLLRYLDIRMRRDEHADTQFFLFKSHFSEEERIAFLRAAGKAQLVDAALPANHDLSFESLWKWFIYRSLINLNETVATAPFKRDVNWERFVACVRAPDRDDDRSGIRRLLPRMNAGKVSIGVSPSLELDFDWDDKEQRTVQFSKLTRQADQLFERLSPAEGRFVLFFDELELSTTSRDRKRRDAELIRDLIVAVEQFNGRCRAKRLDIRVIAAVRSEVLLTIDSVGKEINKSIADFGVPVLWARGGATDLQHPLIDIIIRRLEYSEGTRSEASRNATLTWDSYFPKLMSGKPTPQFLLDQSWYRPRDMVRLLNIAKTQFPDNERFDENCLTASKKEYAYQSWVEITEELATRYDRDEIEAVRTILSGFTRYFYSHQFAEHLDSLSGAHAGVRTLRDNYGSDRLLIDLYSVGILGNAVEITQASRPALRYRYNFRGDFTPILANLFVVHSALCPSFGIV